MNDVNEQAKNSEEIEELICQSQSGEGRALEELLRIYEKLILRISRRYYFQDGETEDVIQECRIAFWNSIMNYKSLRSSVSLESFAYICINRRLASALRKRTKQGTKIHNDAMLRKSILIKDSYGLDKDLIVAEDDIENDYIFKETRKAYFEQINQNISKECGQIAKMREDGYSYKEIGKELNISVKKVDNSIRKIRKKMGIDKNIH